jgi:hypothetical protein
MISLWKERSLLSTAFTVADTPRERPPIILLSTLATSLLLTLVLLPQGVLPQLPVLPQHPLFQLLLLLPSQALTCMSSVPVVDTHQFLCQLASYDTPVMLLSSILEDTVDIVHCLQLKDGGR